MTLRLAAALLAASALACCKPVGPDFSPPTPDLPSNAFQRSAHGSGQAADAVDTQRDWWKTFKDPILSDLEGRVASQNLDVRAATIRIAESRFQAGVAGAALLPSIGGQAKDQKELYSSNGLLSMVDGLLQNVAPGSTFSPKPINEYTLGADASWQIDLWGGVRRQIEAAHAQTQSSEAERRGALIASFAELADDYVALRAAQAKGAITQENLAAEQDILNLTKDRSARGLASALDVEAAESQVDGVKSQLPQLTQQISQSMNAIAILLDLPPDALNAQLARPKAQPPAPSSIPLGVPSQLAQRRPDIQEAEARLHAATADIGVAQADFYPNVQLSGAAALDSLHLANLFAPGSLQYSLGPTATLPIFEGGKLKSNLELRKAQQQEAALAYRKTVLNAWREVVDALVSLRQERLRRAQLGEQVGHARTTLTLAKSRYASGLANMTTVLDAERGLLAAQQQYVESTADLSHNAIRLYKALGGGWENFPADDAKSASAATH